jgi:DNA-binding response OmpR family regulator
MQDRPFRKLPHNWAPSRPRIDVMHGVGDDGYGALDRPAGHPGAPTGAGGARQAQLLIVEDDQETLLLLVEWLQDYGFAIRTAATGEEGLARCRDAPPDLILLDIGVPPPDGFAVLAALKADARLWPIPVLLLTGRADASSKVEAFRIGAHDYLTKPVEERELAARIARHLNLSRLYGGLLRRLDAYELRFGPLDDRAAPPEPGTPETSQVAQLCRARDLIERHLAEPLSSAELARAVGLSQRALARGFAALFGSTIRGYVREARLQRARRLLLSSDLLVKTIALEVGYRQTSDLTRAITARFGATPTELRAGANATE